MNSLISLTSGELMSWIGTVWWPFVRFSALLWAMPVYLLLMQKRVYGQGWVMTLLKYGVLGTCYSILLSFAIVASFGKRFGITPMRSISRAPASS